VLISHIRTVTVQTVQLRFQNDWARVSQLIETEVAEGVTLTPAAGAGCTDGTTLFTINVPVIRPVTAGAGEDPETTAPSVELTPTGDVQISYNQVGPDLQRCGPPINPDGTLDTTADEPVAVLLLSNATLTLATPLNPGDRALEYNLTLTDPFPPAFSAPFQRTFPAVGQFVQVRTRLDQYAEGLASSGLDETRQQALLKNAAIWRWVYVGESRAQAEDELSAALVETRRHMVHAREELNPPDFKVDPNMLNPWTDAHFSEAEGIRFALGSGALIGSAKDIAEQVAALRDAGAGHLLCQMSFGYLGHHRIKASMRRFAEGVMPHFK
jgi:hypothetical protein